MSDPKPIVSGKCLIVHPVLPHPPDALHNVSRSIDAQIEEATGLAAAIEMDVVHADSYRVNRISPGHLLGSGARETIHNLIKDLQPDVVVVNHTLSPVQQRNLEKDWETKVIDRTGLILEIFGARAQSAEGKIQVELARLTYERSRLVRSWTHLERQRGGTGGTGGPGESQLELDRRLIDDRIARLKRDLEQVKQHRDLERKGRDKVPFPVVAIVGYTNAGKSTLFNTMTGADVFAKDLLFATLDTTMRKLELPNGADVILSDTVGFISDLPTNLIAAFRATLEQLQHAAVILHVRDVTAPDFVAQGADVVAIMHDLGIEAENDDRVIEVWNKTDALDAEHLVDMQRRARENTSVVLTAARVGAGLDDLKLKIQEILSQTHSREIYRVPLSDGKAQAWLHSHAHVIHTEVEDDMMVFEVEIDPVSAERFGVLYPNAA